MIEFVVWMFILMIVAYSGYRVGHMFVDGDAKAESDMAMLRAAHWKAQHDQVEAELQELQAEYQKLYRETQRRPEGREFHD